MRTKCPACGEKAAAVRKDYRFQESGLKNVVLKNIEVVECSQCGDLPRIPRLNDLMRAIALALIVKPVELTGEDVRFLRKFLQLTADRFSRVLGVDPSTVSRWETGDQEIGQQSDRLIRLVAFHMGDGLKAKAEEVIAQFEKIERGRKKPARSTVEVDTETMTATYKSAA